MGIREIRELLDTTPFEPFRIHVTSGEVYEVRDPQSVALMRSRLFVAYPRSDRWTFIPYLHIATIDSAGNGRKSSRRKGRR